MRKIVLFIIALAVYSITNAQEKKFWVDIELERSFGLNQWFDNQDINNGLRKNQSTDIKARINFLSFRNKNIGIYSDLAVSLYSYNKNRKEQNYLNELDAHSYYFSSSFFSDTNSNPGARLTVGGFYRFRFKKFDLIPHLGFGLEDLNERIASYSAKERDTNTRYTVNYIWHPNENNFISGHNLITAFQLTSSYKLTNTTSLILGINYRIRLYKPKFKASIIDYYDKTVVDEIEVKGKNMQTIGISLGVSFGQSK